MSCFVVGAADMFGVQDGDGLESAPQDDSVRTQPKVGPGTGRCITANGPREERLTTTSIELRRPRGVVFCGVGKCVTEKGYVRSRLHVHAVGSQLSFQLVICERVLTVSPSGVGEAVRQLQLLFEEAKSSQPR